VERTLQEGPCPHSQPGRFMAADGTDALP
jgi:hypothetical protein